MPQQPSDCQVTGRGGGRVQEAGAGVRQGRLGSVPLSGSAVYRGLGRGINEERCLPTRHGWAVVYRSLPAARHRRKGERVSLAVTGGGGAPSLCE